MISSNRNVPMFFYNVAHFFTHMFMLLFPTVVLALEREWRVPYSQLIPLTLPAFVLYGVGALPGGWLADRWSARGVLIIMLVGTGGAAVLTGMARSPFEMACGLGLIGLFASLYHPVGLALVTRDAESRGRALGVNALFGSLGMASAGLVASGLSDSISWRAAFFVPGALALLTGLAYSAVPRISETIAVRTPVRKDQQEPSALREVTVAFLPLAVASLATSLLFNATSIALPKVVETGGMMGAKGIMSVGAWVSLMFLFGGLAQLAGGFLSDRFPLRRIYVVCYLIQIPALLVAGILGGLPMLLATGAVVIVQLIAIPVNDGLYAEYSPPRWRATAFGARFAVSLAGSSLAVPIVAIVYGLTGEFMLLFGILGVLALLSAGTMAFLPAIPRATVKSGDLQNHLSTGRAELA